MRKEYTYIAYMSPFQTENYDDLPIAVAETARELGRQLGMSENNVIHHLLLHRNGKKNKVIIYRYMYNQEEDEGKELKNEGRAI